MAKVLARKYFDLFSIGIISDVWLRNIIGVYCVDSALQGGMLALVLIIILCKWSVVEYKVIIL